jgi:hypothetical protein
MRWAALAIAVAVVSPALVSIARAPRADEPGSAESPPVDETSVRKERAKERFLAGVGRMQSGAWDAALAEFRAALADWPTSNTRKNAAICLTKLQRWDEALEMWELRLREFGAQMPAAEIEETNRAILELKPLVGTLEVRAGVEGAIVLVDGRERGRTPLARPIVVGAGTHLVRVVKEGWAPFETQISVAGKAAESIDAKLEALARVGRLQVLETAGRIAEVIVDGVVVGTTPTEVVVPPGPHTVQLRGEGVLGTQPAVVRVAVDERAVLRLELVPLEGAARIEPTPPDASLVLDSVPLGHGAWSGRLAAGTHRIEVFAEGFLPTVRTVEIPKGSETRIPIVLERDESSPLWAQSIGPRISITGVLGFALAPGLGGEIETSCGAGATCDARTRPWGFTGILRAGYRLGPRGAVEGSVGYLRMAYRVSRRTRLPGEGGPVDAEIRDGVATGGPFVGLGASYAIVREGLPLTVALTAGLQIARTQTDREGSVVVDDAPSPRPLFPASSDPVVSVVPLVIPEIRLERPIGDRWAIVASLIGIVGFGGARPRIAQAPQGSPNDVDAGQPRPPRAGGEFVGFLPQQTTRPESAVGTFVAIGLTLGARISF